MPKDTAVPNPDTSRRDLEHIRSDYAALGMRVQAMGGFSLILLEKGQGLRRSRQILWVTKWVHYWY